MSNSYTFFAPGKPAPQGSKKVHRYIKGRAILGESSAAVDPWRKVVASCARRLRPEQWHAKLPVSLTLTFVFARPNDQYINNRPGPGRLKPNAPQHCTKRIGDLDKLCRAVCDALTGIAYDYDSQVFSINAERRYATASESPGALITITTIDV